MTKNWTKLMIAVALVAGLLSFSASPARASFIIRATEYSGAGVAEATANSGVIGTASGSLNTALPDFTVTLVNNIVTTGGSSTAHSTTINITYNGPTSPQASSDSLLVEVLGTGYSSPASGNAVVNSNASPSTSGLMMSNVGMTSGVLSGSATLNTVTVGTTTLAGTPLTGTMGTTLGSGTMGGASSVLIPNPTSGATFAVPNPFSFYQTYLFAGATSTGSGSLSAGTQVDSTAVPEPASCLLALTSLPMLGFYGWRRCRSAIGKA